MAAIETAYTAAETEAMCDDAVVNPDTDEQDKEIHITLQDQTGEVTMRVVYDALNTAFDTVATNDVVARNSAVFVITA